MKRTTALQTATIGLAGMLAGGLSSCRGEDVEFDCASQQENFEAAYADDGILLETLPDVSSYPMAMVFSELGLQNLLNGLVGSDVPFASKLNIGPYGINFFPLGAPTIEIVEIKNCPGQCILFSLDYDVQVEDEDGDPAGAGNGKAKLAIPLKLIQNDDGSSDLVAVYDKAIIKDMPFNSMNIDTQDYPGLEGALEILATQALQAQYKTTTLLHFEPWTIGGNEVKLSVQDFALFNDTKVLSLAMQTNLDLPRSASVPIGKALPMGIPLQVQMHPGLLLGMAQRMITEGEISRTYNDAGNPDPKGLYGVTLETLTPNKIPGSKLLDVGFKVWRTQDGYCGYANAETTLGLDIDQATNNIKVTPGDDLRVTGGEGVGELAENNQELIDKNKKLVDQFKKDLSEQVGITLNYKEVGVEGSRILFDTQTLLVNPNSIDIIIDFEVVAAEDDG